MSASKLSSLSEKQMRVQEYLQKHKIEQILADILNTLAHSMDSKPVIFMIKYLASLCSTEELQNHGISMHSEAPESKLALTYPEFQLPNLNLFKKHLTNSVFADLRQKKTSSNSTLRDLIEIALEHEDHPIGVFVPNQESLSAFSNLFDPILTELNEGHSFEGSSLREKSTPIQDVSLNLPDNHFIKSVRVNIRRNLEKHSFNCLLDSAERDIVQEKIQHALMSFSEFDFKSEFLGELSDETIRFLQNDMGMSALGKKSYQGRRYKDWHHGRRLYLNKAGNSCVFVNRDDHFEYSLYQGKDINLEEAFKSSLAFISNLEEKLPFAFDSKYGYVSTNPKYVGLGFKIRIYLEIPEEKLTSFQQNLSDLDLSQSIFSIEQMQQNNCWMIRNRKNLGNFGEAEMLSALEKVIIHLSKDTTEKDLSKTMAESEEGQEVEKENGEVLTENPDHQVEIEESPQVASHEKEPFSLDQSIIEADYPALKEGDFGIVKKGYLVVRRNLEDFPLKNEMTLEANEKIVGFLSEFSNALPRGLAGSILRQNDEGFQQTIDETMKEFEVTILQTADKSEESKAVYGTSIFQTNNKRLFVLTNLEDHLTLIYNLNGEIISNALREIRSLLDILEKKSSGFAFKEETGFITINPANIGSGFEISYQLNLQTSIEEIQSIVPSFLQSNKNDRIVSLKINSICPLKIKALHEHLISFIQQEKEMLYSTKYKQELQTLYGQEFIAEIESTCQTNSCQVLDLFNSKLEIQLSDASTYLQFKETFSKHLSQNLEEKTERNSLKHMVQQYNFSDFAGNSENFHLKVDIGRNLSKYPFRKLMSIPEKEELEELVQDTMNALKIEGEILSANQLTETQSELQTLIEPSSNSLDGQKVFVATNRRFACWINQFDHLRFILCCSILDLAESLEMIESVINKLEEESSKMLFDESLGYLSEKLSLCGHNLTLKISFAGSKETIDQITKEFIRAEAWKKEDHQDHDQENASSIFVSKPQVKPQSLFETISQIAKQLKNRESEPKQNEVIEEANPPVDLQEETHEVNVEQQVIENDVSNQENATDLNENSKIESSVLKEEEKPDVLQESLECSLVQYEMNSPEKENILPNQPEDEPPKHQAQDELIESKVEEESEQEKEDPSKYSTSLTEQLDAKNLSHNQPPQESETNENSTLNTDVISKEELQKSQVENPFEEEKSSSTPATDENIVSPTKVEEPVNLEVKKTGRISAIFKKYMHEGDSPNITDLTVSNRNSLGVVSPDLQSETKE